MTEKITKIWIDDALAIVSLIPRNCKIVKDSRFDGICFEKLVGFNVVDLNFLFINYPTTIVEYPDSCDFVRNLKRT